MATHSSILAGKISWSLVGYNPWGHKGSDTTEQLSTPREGYREGLRQWLRGWEKRYNAGWRRSPGPKHDLDQSSLFAGSELPPALFSEKEIASGRK